MIKDLLDYRKLKRKYNTLKLKLGEVEKDKEIAVADKINLMNENRKLKREIRELKKGKK